MPVFCGIDWAEDHYDVSLVDGGGVVLARRRIADDCVGYQLLLELLAEHGDNQHEPIPVAIETPRGLLVACLRRTGRQIHAINPLSVARYRDRHSVARAKSDRVDAELLTHEFICIFTRPRTTQSLRKITVCCSYWISSMVWSRDSPG